MNPMNHVKRTLLTLGLVVPLALLAALAPLGAGHRTFAISDPEECPAHTGSAFVRVARDPDTYRYADQTTGSVVCIRFRSTHTCIPIAVLIDDRGSGDPNTCLAPFVLTPGARPESRVGRRCPSGGPQRRCPRLPLPDGRALSRRGHRQHHWQPEHWSDRPTWV